MKNVLLFQHLFVIGSKTLACAGNQDALLMLQMHAQSDPNCPSNCVGVTGKSWFDKCFWEKCKECSACSNEPAVLEGKQCFEKCVRATETTWQDKCLWDGCQMCNSCGSALKEEKARLDLNCPSTCVDATGKSWFDKCFWEQCQTCSVCSDEPAVLEGKECSAKCVRATETKWQDKCLWDGCQMCNSCSGSLKEEDKRYVEDKDCPPSCADKTQKTWFEKCFWEKCQTCSACSNEPAVLEGKQCSPKCVKATETTWQDKCLWDDCQTCNSCGGVSLKEERDNKSLLKVVMENEAGIASNGEQCMDESHISHKSQELYLDKKCQAGFACVGFEAGVSWGTCQPSDLHEAKQVQNLCVMSKTLCDDWLAAGKSCSAVWSDECPGVEHESGKNDITLADGCPDKCSQATAAMPEYMDGSASTTNAPTMGADARDLRQGSTAELGFCAHPCVYTKDVSWDEKCGWPGCQGCGNCQKEQPAALQESCPSKCLYTNGKGWDDKCKWGACKGCNECMSQPGTVKLGCHSKCVYTVEKSWDEKCAWGFCTGCTECNNSK